MLMLHGAVYRQFRYTTIAAGLCFQYLFVLSMILPIKQIIKKRKILEDHALLLFIYLLYIVCTSVKAHLVTNSLS